MLLEGIFLPLTTPFYPDGRVYLRKLEHNVGRYSLSGAAGMVVGGTAGEGDGLSSAEAVEALQVAIAVAAKEKVMVAGVSRESVYDTLKLAEAAAAAGYDAVAVRGPACVAGLGLEMMTYFRTVADRSGLPVVLVSDTERELAVEVVGELAGHPNVIGMVEEGDSVGRVAGVLGRTAGVQREVRVTTVFAAATGRMMVPVAAGAGTFVSAESLGHGGGVATAPPVAGIKTRTKKVGFQVLFGTTRRMLEAWGAGASGAVPRMGACAPQGVCEVWQAYKDGDQALAEEKQERVRAAGKLMEGWGGVAAVKYGCDLNGYFGGRPRLPLLALDEAGREAVEVALEGLRV